MAATPCNTPNKGRSLDRQITAKDVDCLKEAFALFDIDRQEEISTRELGKVRIVQHLYWEDLLIILLVQNYVQK